MAEATASVKDAATGALIPIDGVDVSTAPSNPVSGHSLRQKIAIGASDGSTNTADPDGAGNLKVNVVVIGAALALAAGAAIIGKVGIDQSSPGTSNGVVVNNLPSNQAVTVDGSLPNGVAEDSGGAGTLGMLGSAVKNLRSILAALQGSLEVTGTFWPSTQPVSGTVAVSSLPGAPAQDGTDTTGVIPPLGALGIRGWLSAIYAQLGTTLSAAITNFPSSFAVSNFPATQPVSGSVSATVSGAVSVSNLPATQPVSGAVTVSNLPATQPVSAVSLPLPTGAAADGTDATGVTAPAGAVGIRGWLSAIYQAIIAGIGVTVANFPSSFSVSNFPATQPVSVVGIVEIDGMAEAPTGVPVPLSADFMGYANQQGNLTGVSPTMPLPVAEAHAAAAQSSDAPLFVAIAGDPSGDFAGVNLLEKLMDDGDTFSIGARVVNPPKMDAQRAHMQSDCPAPIILAGVVGSVFIIDTTGYDSLHFTTQASFVANVTQGNDLELPFAILTGYNVNSGAFASTVNGGITYAFPCTARYIRFSLTAAGTATAYLRAQPFAMGVQAILQCNLSQISGTTTANAGVNGVIAVGGFNAPGAVAATYPVPVGGCDSGSVTRRILTDTSGRVQVSAIDNTGTARAVGAVAPSYMNLAALAVEDLTLHEGLSREQLLAQILVELKVVTHYLFNIGMGSVFAGSDDPDALRNDVSLATIQ